jgi:hypothetical protein
MDQGDRHAKHADGDLIVHIHLVDGDGARRGIGRQRRERVGLHVTAADEKTALAGNGERTGIGTRGLRDGRDGHGQQAGGEQQCAHDAFLPKSRR